MTSAPTRTRWGPTLVIGIGAAVGLAAVGLIFARPDIVAVGLPLALCSVLTLGRGRAPLDASVTVERLPGDGELRTRLTVAGRADAVEVLVVQSQRRSRRVLAPPGATIESRSAVLHSGPVLAVQVVSRPIASDGAVFAPASEVVIDPRAVAPREQRVDDLPLPRNLSGMHGSHEGRRVGQGGDFRDIHPFAPGDELRRVDWRATARLARSPGDLLVRRTNTLSDASVVIAMDTAEDLGEVVASWGTGDLERSGTTSLDLARQAARAIAASAIAVGDRVALHVLVSGGPSVRSGGGSRHLARLESMISSIGQASEDARFRRTPPVPHGSVIVVLSTFFEGAAARTALLWRASGHRVVAIDVLPRLDGARLTREQALALRVVLAERDGVLADLRGAGVDVLAWSEDAPTALRIAERSRR